MNKIIRKRLDKIKAFTLSEVLITLGIIGVVAALTIPSLINSTQNKEHDAAFKKMYANLSNAINLVTQENGGTAYQCFTAPGYDYHSTECTLFWDEVLKKMGSPKKCTGGFASGCQPQYIDSPEVLTAGGDANTTTCYGSNGDTNSKETYTLADGGMILSYGNVIDGISLFAIDTNGFKKPNKWGYDVFSLTLDASSTNPGTVFISDRICWLYEKGGKRVSNILSGN